MQRNPLVRSLACALAVLMLLATPMAGRVALASSSTLANRGDVYVVTASRLNARTGAGVSHAVKKRLSRGASVTYYSQSRGWWYVRDAAGDYVYVDPSFLALKTVSKAGNYATVANLRVRKAATTSASTLGVLAKGTQVYVSRFDGDWGYVSSGNLNGWVALRYLSAGGSAGSGSTATDATSYTVVADRLNMRENASSSARILRTLSQGTIVSVTRTSGNWAYGTSGSSSGWLSLSYLSKGGAGTGGAVGGTVSEGSYQVSASDVNVREEATTASKSLGKLARSTLVRVIRASGSWAYISYVSGNAIKYGWISAQYLTPIQL